MGRVKESTYKTCAEMIGCEVEAFKAVKNVETGGRGGFVGEGKPAILFEGHIFWQQLKKRGIDPKEKVVGNEDILYRKWTKKYYLGGIDEYNRLNKAKKIDEEAALASASWGIFQVMGFNFEDGGYSSVREFVDAMCKSEDEQVIAAARFICKNNGMKKALINKDWATFASLYNGPKYYENKYDEKLECEYIKLKG